MKQIKQTTFFCTLFCFFNLFVYAQNVDYDAYIYQFTSWEGGIGGACWESGTEEYTRNGWIMDNFYNAETAATCQQCNNNGNCTSTGTWARQTRNNVPTTAVRARIDAWEDDGTRCSYNSGDDCRTNTNTWLTLTPVEYQWTAVNWNTGNGNHRAYATCNHKYTVVTLEAAVDNTTYSYTTGGNRPFWGAVGSWATNGGDCATSGTITDGQSSSFSTTVSCIDQVSFRWRADSEANYDFLRFYIDGVQQAAISGITAWSIQTYALDPNTDHTLEWRYTKDGSISSGLDRGFVDQVIYNSYTIPVAGTSFGANAWNVAAYNGRSLNLSGVTYRGYYVENNLNVNTQSHWVSGGTPSDASSYDGCSVGIDNHTTVHKRQGFPCANYRIDVVGHDDEIRIYVDGAQVFEHIGCCDPHAGVWSGFLSSTSTVEIRTAEGGGGSNTQVNLIDITATASGGTISNNQTICSGATPSTLSNTVNAAGAGNITYQWQSSPNNSTWSNIAGATGVNYSPPTLTQTMYYRRQSTDQCGTVAYANTITITVESLSTAPSPTPIGGKICPNTDIALSASGGIAGAGSGIYWYSDAAATTLIGTGSVTVTPSQTSTYYVRREGTCNNSNLEPLVVNVRDYIYAPVGTNLSSNFCDDNLGWRHFYDLNDDIIFSVQGDFSGITTMNARVDNNGTYFQETEGPTFTPADCASGWSPGEERFELPRSWNINYTGTLTGTYNLRYYFPAAEKTNMETAAINHIAAWPACAYTYKYNPGNNGFFWFKNSGTPYSAPQFETPLQLSGSSGTINTINYAEITGVTSFSGGSGSIILEPLSSLPVELTSFEGENQGLKNYITWETEIELNNDYYALERSSNLAEGFETIATIKGAGTTNEIQNYSFIDESPTIGINYYRLKQVDFDGTSSLSKIIALEVKGKLSDYAFFPNPTKGEVTYQFNSQVENNITIKVINALGQTIQSLYYDSKLGLNSIKIDLSEYPAGNYLIQVSDNQMERVITERITKIH